MEIVLRVSWSIISGWQKRDKYSSNIVATVHTKFIKWFIDYCEIRQFAVDIFTIPHTIWTRNGIEFGKINARLFQIFEGNIRLIHLTSMLVGQQIFNKKSHSFHIYSPEEIYSRCSTSFFLLFTRKSWFYELHTIYMVFEAATTVLLWPGFSFLFSYWLFWKDFGAVYLICPPHWIWWLLRLQMPLPQQQKHSTNVTIRCVSISREFFSPMLRSVIIEIFAGWARLSFGKWMKKTRPSVEAI